MVGMCKLLPWLFIELGIGIPSTGAETHETARRTPFFLDGTYLNIIFNPPLKRVRNPGRTSNRVINTTFYTREIVTLFYPPRIV